MHAADITIRIQSGGRDLLPAPTTTLRDWNGRGHGTIQHNPPRTLALALAVAPAREADEDEEEGSGQQTGSAEVILQRRALQGSARQHRRGMNVWGWGRSK